MVSSLRTDSNPQVIRGELEARRVEGTKHLTGQRSWNGSVDPERKIAEVECTEYLVQSEFLSNEIAGQRAQNPVPSGNIGVRCAYVVNKRADFEVQLVRGEVFQSRRPERHRNLQQYVMMNDDWDG